MSPPRKNIKQATIKDVAQGAGLSITAVSLVLNGKPNHIPEATRRRILDAADELNYVPNQVARAMQQMLDIVTDEVPYMILDYPKVLMVTDQRVQNATFAAMYQYSLLFKEFNVTD